jgi:hypothetical protein
MSTGKCDSFQQKLKKEFPEKRVLTYTGSSDDNTKKDFNDVINIWNKADVLIYSPTCEAGVNFDIDHFDRMFAIYTRNYPTFLDSRQNFAIFVFRAHNTVNKRLDKPRPSTVAEALSNLRTATNITSPTEYRSRYLTYLMNNWSRQGGGEGFMKSANVREMQKINNEYWNLRETGFSISFPESDILQPIIAVPSYVSPYNRIQNSGNSLQSVVQRPVSSGLIFKGGRFQLGNR